MESTRPPRSRAPARPRSSRPGVLAAALVRRPRAAHLGSRGCSTTRARSILAANDLDPSAYLWFFAWWPHALLNGLDPFYTELIFVPDGYNLAWVTSMPGPSILLAPVTLTLGSVAAVNLISFAAPALSAWTAFLLCRHVTGSVPASLLGGYLFGFSPYMLNQLRGAPQLALMALVPVLVLVTIRHAEGSLSGRAFVAAMTATFTAQILTSTEVFATAVLFGGLTLLAAYLLYAERREALRRTAVLAGAALGGTAVLGEPAALQRLLPRSDAAGAGARRFPRRPALLRRARAARGRRTGAGGGDAAELGDRGRVPRARYCSPCWRPSPCGIGATAVPSWCFVAFAVPAVAALGTYLHVGGTDTGIPMPWLAFDGLPLLRYAIPLRFPAFAFLAAGLAAAMWLARRPSRARWALALVAVACLLPAVGNDDWHTRLDDVPFFADGGYEGRLSGEDNVLTVPTWGRNMYWHVQGDFSFRLAAGYVGAFPESYMRYRAWRDLLRVPLGQEGVPSLPELHRFVADKEVTALVVERDHPLAGRRVYRSLAGPPVEAGGVLLYRLRAAREVGERRGRRRRYVPGCTSRGCRWSCRPTTRSRRSPARSARLRAPGEQRPALRDHGGRQRVRGRAP